MARYGFYYNEAVAGQIYQARPRDIISLPAYVQTSLPNYTEGPIFFGYPVVYYYLNAANQGAMVTNDPELSSNFIGIAVLSHTCEIEESTESEDLDFGAAYFNKDVVPVLTKGKIWVNIRNGVNVKVGDKAYLSVFLTSAGQPFHEFTNVATNSSDSTDNIQMGVFVTGTNEQNLAVLQFDLSANKVIL